MRRVRLASFFVGVLLLRAIWPLADPPTRLTWSNGEFTDPAAIVHSARNVVLFGEWMRDESRDLVYFPILNAAAAGAFQVFGVSRLTMQGLFAILGTATVLVGWWAVGRVMSPGGRALAAAFLGVSFWIVMHSRIPVAENIVVPLLLAAAGLALGRSKREAFASGLVAGIAALFGKITAVLFIPALLVWIIARTQSLGSVLAVVGGLTSAAALWWVTIVPIDPQTVFAPFRGSGSGYAAMGVDRSFYDLAVSPMRALRNSWMFLRFPLLAGLGSWYATRTFADSQLWKSRVESGAAIFSLWIALGWVFLSLLPYQAPRYYVLVGVPLAIAAGLQIADWASMNRVAVPWPGTIRAAVCFGIWLVFAVFGAFEISIHGLPLISERLLPTHPEFSLSFSRFTAPWVGLVSPFGESSRLALGVAGFLLGGAWLAGRQVRSRAGRGSSGLPGKRVATVALAGVFLFDGLQFVDWSMRHTRQIEEAKASFDAIVGPDAILYGAFAPTLVQDSKRVCVPHLVPPLYPKPEAGVFARHGVTHVVLGLPGEASVVEDIEPGLTSRLELVQTWPLRTHFLQDLAVFRIRPAEGDSAPAYTPTSYEQAMTRFLAKDPQGAMLLLDRAKSEIHANIPDMASLRAQCWIQLGDMQRVREALERALAARPSCRDERYSLGVLLENSGHRDEARAQWRRAYRDAPMNENLVRALRPAP